MVDASFAGKFLFTQTTAMAKHGGKTYAGGSRKKKRLYQQHLYSPKISMHIYKPKKLNELNLCGLRDWIFSSPSTPICAPKLASDRVRLRT